jgi:hypothetical protein
VNKECNTCHRVKPVSEFYVHSGMRDGLLPRCKLCHKQAAQERRLILEQDPEWKKRENERHRLKSRKYRAEARDKILTPQYRAEVQRRHRAKHPLANAARKAVHRAVRAGLLTPLPCEVCGKKAQAHHEDYSKALSVIWLCQKHHNQADIKRREKNLPTT